jgi:MFS family permease
MRKVSRVVQTVRDAILVVLSIVLISTDIGPEKEMANYFLAGICGVILVLTVVNICLNAFKVNRKGYFYGNSIFQLVLSFLLLGLFPPLGIILLMFNFAVIASLTEKKTLEEQMKHPPKPVTTKHRILVGAGVLVMLLSIFLSWLSNTNFPLIRVYFGAVNLSVVSSTVSASAVTVIFGLLALVGSPFSIIIGSLGLLRRRFAWISGILALVIGIGWIIALTTVAGPGSFVFLFGGVLVLSARFISK